MKPKIVLSLTHSKDNPRNSEGAFINLADGRIMFAYSRYRGNNWHDHGAADIAARFSSDGGETWSKHPRILIPNEGRCNVMSVSLLNLTDGRIALFYLRKNSHLDCRLWMRVSEDNAGSWSEPTLCIPAPGYFVVNNDRVIALRDGRLLVPAAYHRPRLPAGEPLEQALDGRGVVLIYYSDDGGQNWQEARDWAVLPIPSQSGLQEPGVVELRNGEIYGWARTDCGVQWEMRSADRGETWSPPIASPFRSPCSPMSMKRIPHTGELLAVWNEPPGPGDGTPDTTGTEREEENRTWGRTPLVVALSNDEGRSWHTKKIVENDPERGFCYTAIHFSDDCLLLAYCCGGKHSVVLQDSRITKISLAWLYDKNVSLVKKVKTITGNAPV
ncbi:MAG: glycoside hydrolase [Desulfobulbaceae bacterium]|nr:glycoside hydrolase [Desulfobulbaceae bacterium]